MNTLYENMKRFGTKNLQESIWDIGALLRNRSDIINLAKPVVTPNPENPRKRYWREQPDGSLKYYHDKKGTIPWTEKDNQVELNAKVKLAKKLINNLGGQEEAEEILTGAFESTDKLIPIIRPFIGKDAELEKDKLSQMAKILSPSKSDFFVSKIIAVAKAVGVKIT